MTNIARAAEFLAQQWPCFPCNLEKRPVTRHGLKDASRELHDIRRMFREINADMIGVPTGAASGFVVVDLDVKEGASGLEWLAANEHRLPQTRRHRTRSGGVHLLFNVPVSRTIRNSASKLAPGVDVRGEGGYVIVPPSPGYEIADETMPADMPGWLLDLIDPPQAPRAPIPAPIRRESGGQGTRYGMSALDDECQAIMAAGFGAQEHTLNAAALKIGGLIAGGELERGYAMSALMSAASAMPSQSGRPAWGSEEIRRKIERGVQDGMATPRQAPPREVRHTIRVEIVPPEAPPLDEAPPYWEAEPDVDIPPAAAEIRQARAEDKPPLPLVYFGQVEPCLDAADFVEGVLTENAMSVVYGPSNCGKTFFVSDLALHVATGREWRGREIEAGGVVYCALEGGHGIANRVAAWRKHYGYEGVDVPFAVVPVTINLLDPDADRARLVATIVIAAINMGVPVKLIVIDTLSRAMAGGNENAPDDMGALVASADFIRQSCKAHICFIHHSGKDEARGARGHSLLRAATDTEIEISRQDSMSPSVARVTKQREMEIEGEFVFKLAVHELGLNRRGKAVSSCVVEVVEGEAPPKTQRKAGKLPDGAQIAFDSLSQATSEHGTRRNHAALPPGILTVLESEWRRAFYARLGDDTPEAKKKAFQRATSALQGRRVAIIQDGFAWIVKQESSR